MTTYRVEPCVCGGSIRATSLGASGLAVAEHNRTAGHVIWRMLVSFSADPRCVGFIGRPTSRCDSYRNHPGPHFVRRLS